MKAWHLGFTNNSGIAKEGGKFPVPPPSQKNTDTYSL